MELNNRPFLWRFNGEPNQTVKEKVSGRHRVFSGVITKTQHFDSNPVFREFVKTESELFQILIDLFGLDELKKLREDEHVNTNESNDTDWDNPKSVIQCMRLFAFGRKWSEDKISAALGNYDPFYEGERFQADKKTQTRINRLNEERLELKNKLVVLHLRLALNQSKVFSRCIESIQSDDFQQESVLGMMEAIDRYDPDRGIQFSTYAMWWIRHQLKNAVVKQSQMIRTPYGIHDLSMSVRKLVNEYEVKYNVYLTPAEIAEKLEIPVYKIEAMTGFKNKNCMVWLDSAINEKGDSTVHDVLASSYDSFGSCGDADMKEVVEECLSSLPSKERNILELRFGLSGKEPKTLKEVGEIYGLSRERVRQLEARALKSLHHKTRVENKTISDFV
jgi:RNA polymerase primary sigma factor